MRKFNWLLAAMMLFTLSFAACTEPTPEPDQPTPPTPTEKLTLDVFVGEATMTTVEYTVTPSDLEAEYLVLACTSAAVDNCANDAAIIELVYGDMKSYAESNGKTFEEYVAGIVKKGAIEDGLIQNLATDTSYYLLVFGVDAAQSYATTTDIVKNKFRTQAAAINNCTFTLKVESYLTNAALDVTPTDNNQTWTIATVEEATYKTYIDEDGEYGWTRAEFFQNYVATAISDLKNEGLSDAQISNKLLHTGAKTLNVSNLKPSTKYVAFVGGIKIEGESVIVETQVREVYYKSGEAAATDLSFEIEVSNIDYYSADIRITPSDLNANYYYAVLPYDGKLKDAKAIDLVANFISTEVYYWDEGKIAHIDPVKGIQDFTGENKYELNIANMEYYILVFGYELNPNYGQQIEGTDGTEESHYDTNPGTLTSAPALVTFTTPEGGNAMDATFTMTATNVGPYSFTIDIKTDDPTIYYQPGLTLPGQFNASELISKANSNLSTYLQMSRDKEPGISIQRALEEDWAIYYRNGDAAFGVANIMPLSSYDGYLLVIDAVQGAVVNAIEFKDFVTTTDVGSVTPEIEILGIYDGNEEAGTIFGDEDMTTGCFIAAVTHNNINGATGLYGAITMGDVTDTTSEDHKLSDTYIYSEYMGYWSNINLSVPYEFYIAEWDSICSLLAYATDGNGRAGHIARKLIDTTGAIETGAISELQAYVNEANAAKSTQAIKSLVIDECNEPQMTCIWNEEVPAPRAAEVIYHDVEPIEAESDIVMVKSILGVRF